MTFARKSFRATALVLGTGGVLLGLATPAVAAPPPGCTVADVSDVAAGVDAAIAAYLFSHPDVNNFFTGLQGQNKDSVRAQANAYFQSNPQVKAELDALRAPSVDLRNRCGIPAAAIILGVL